MLHTRWPPTAGAGEDAGAHSPTHHVPASNSARPLVCIPLQVLEEMRVPTTVVLDSGVGYVMER